MYCSEAPGASYNTIAGNVKFDTETANFCLTPNGVHNDIEVSMYPIDNARLGFDAQYLIVYKNNGNQIASGSVTLNFNDALIDFGIFPNPAQDRLNISSNGSENIKSIEIYKVLGQMLYSNEQAQNQWSIDVSNLQTDNYLIKMNTQNGTGTQHFLKK